MDEIARYNAERWKGLAHAHALFTRPWLDLDANSAQARIDPARKFGDLRGKHVLCLAGGGGKQSAAFALLGATVTVVDLSLEQLERDQQAAAHYGSAVTTLQGDMRDLSTFATASFDLVDQPYSLNFVPDAREVFAQVARVIKPGGIYRFMCANPFAAGMTERDWNGDGYTVKRPYQQGKRIIYKDPDWVYDREQLSPIAPPQEFRQTLGTLINGLIANDFALQALNEVMADAVNIDAEQGTWDHFTAVMPPWFTIHSCYNP